MYRALGLAELGGSLSCQRDFALAQGFNADIELTRTQTIMGGAPFCDFRFGLAAQQGSLATTEPGSTTSAPAADAGP
jgi:hypothetical protein